MDEEDEDDYDPYALDCGCCDCCGCTCDLKYEDLLLKNDWEWIDDEYSKQYHIASGHGGMVDALDMVKGRV